MSSSDRARDTLICAVLGVVSMLLFAWLARPMTYLHDAISPIEEVWAMLHESLPGSASVRLRFGYGRTLTYLPLVLVAPGLLGLSMLRGAVYGLMAPVLFAAARSLGLPRVAAVAGAVAVVTSQPLMNNLRSGHQAYLSIEWVAVALLGYGLATSDRPRAGGALLGLALPFAAMNHPMAAVAGMLVPAAIWAARDRKAASWATLGTGAAFSIPHLIVVASAGGFAALATPDGTDAIGLAALPIVASEIQPPGLLLLVAPVLLAALGREPRVRALGMATCAALVLVALLSAVSAEPQPWYWRPALPMGALCLAGLAALDRRGAVLVAPLALSLATIVGLDFATRPTRWSAVRADVVHQLGAAIDGEGRPVGLAGYGLAPTRAGDWLEWSPMPHWEPLLVDSLLAGRFNARFAVTEEGMAQAPQLVLLEVPGDDDRTADDAWIDRIDAARLPETVLVGAGLGGLALLAPDALSATRIGELACGEAKVPVRYAHLHLSGSLKLPGVQMFPSSSRTNRMPGVADCAVFLDY